MQNKLTRAQQIRAVALQLAIAHAGAKFKSIEDCMADALKLEPFLAKAGDLEADLPEQRPGESYGEEAFAAN